MFLALNVSVHSPVNYHFMGCAYLPIIWALT